MTFPVQTPATSHASSNIADSQPPAKRIDWAGLGLLYLFFWYFSGIVQLLQLPLTIGLRDASLMSFIWFAPVLLFPRFTKPICAILGTVLWAVSVTSLGYWIIYQSEFSQSVIFTILETNPQESHEFLAQYLSLPLLLGVALYSVVAWLLWKRLRPVYVQRPYAFATAFAVLFLNFGYPYIDFVTGKRSLESATNKLYRRMETSTPWQFLTGYLQYRIQLKNVQNLLSQNSSLPPLDNLVDQNGDIPRTLVLVIGESTTSQRMSLYGYPRQTTPRLDALKEKGELLVFSDVITSRPYTIEILQQALSFASQEEPKRYMTEPNLMNLMKQAGYKTFWVTNQQTMTSRNTLLTSFAQQADIAKYLNNNRAQNATSPDQIVFEPFTEFLADPAPKKFIVVHLLGSHSQYQLRYTEEYEVFTGRDHVPENLSDSQAETFNSYDNAILYNDFVVSSLIDIFSKNQANGFLLYFSDHGEDVFNDPEHKVLGRNESKPTLDMYAVPFMVWMTPEWKKTHPHNFGSMLDRPYSNAHFIHTWSDLAGLSYDRFQPEMSLVNQNFKPHPRWIGDPEGQHRLRDFDAIVKKNNPLP